METNVTTDVNAEKLSAAEAELASMKVSMDELAAKNAELLGPIKARLKTTLDAAPDAVKAFYAGKELDPVKDLPQVEAEIARYHVMEKAATDKSIADLDAYRAGLKAKYGTNLPPMDKILVNSTPNKKVVEENTEVDTGTQNGSEKSVMYTELVGKSNYNDQELRAITGRISSMSAYLAAR